MCGRVLFCSFYVEVLHINISNITFRFCMLLSRRSLYCVTISCRSRREDSFASDRARQQMLTPIIYHETNSKDNILVFSLLLCIRIQHLLLLTSNNKYEILLWILILISTAKKCNNCLGVSFDYKKIKEVFSFSVTWT